MKHRVFQKRRLLDTHGASQLIYKSHARSKTGQTRLHRDASRAATQHMTFQHATPPLDTVRGRVCTGITLVRWLCLWLEGPEKPQCGDRLASQPIPVPSCSPTPPRHHTTLKARNNHANPPLPYHHHPSQPRDIMQLETCGPCRAPSHYSDMHAGTWRLGCSGTSTAQVGGLNSCWE